MADPKSGKEAVMKRRRTLVALAALVVLGASAGVIHAITNGVPDGDGHPYVGALFFPETGVLCSGSLIAPTVVLTAGHCTYGATYALVTFESDFFSSGFPLASAEVHTHPGFSWNWQGLLGWDSVDVGVVILAEAQAGPTAALPTVGLVDSLPMKTPVDIVGYGVQYKAPVSGPPRGRWMLDGKRYYAPSQIVASENLNSDVWLKLTANPAQGKGGICFGDSGGPDLLGNTILATNSFVANGNCTGVTYGARIDNADVLDWVSEFLTP
jgi:hypothetical protein